MMLLGGRYAVAEPCSPRTASAAYDLVLDRDVAIVLLPGPWRGERTARRLRLLGADAPDSSGQALLDVGVQADTLYVVFLPEPTALVAPAAAVLGPAPLPQLLEPRSGVSAEDHPPEFSRARVLLTAAALFAATAAALATDGLPTP